MVIASKVIDRRPFGPLSESSSSFFTEDLIPTERQVGFWKSESNVDHKGSKSAFASPLEKIHPMGVNPVGGLEHPGGQASKGQLDILNFRNLVGQEDNTSNLPSISWGDVLSSSRSRLGMSTAFVEPNGANQRVHDYGNDPSRSSLSEVFSSKLKLVASGVPGQSVEAENSGCNGDEPLGSMKEIEAQTIGDLLPDDDDLISGIMDGFGNTGLPNHDDADEDIFCTGGGMELEDDSKNGDNYQEVSFKSKLSGERSINNQPSRYLIVKNINTSIEDSELRLLFQQYGDVQTLHASCKNHGFVTVSYYDIRAAQNAMRALHNKPLWKMNLDVHFSITEVTSKDTNNGILAVSISDSSISDDDLLQVLGVYGDVKEIWKAPTHCNKKLVEFFDVRAAEAALNGLNKGDVPCLKIKVEHSSYGGVRSCLREEYSGEWNQDAITHQLKNSSPGTIGKLGPKSRDNSTVHDLYSPVKQQFNKPLHGFSMSDPQKLSSSPITIESTRQRNNQSTLGEPSGSLGHANIGRGLQAFHPHSLPECHDGICNISKSMALTARNASFRLVEGGHHNNHSISSSDLHGHSCDQNEAFGFTGVGSCPLHGHNYTWSNSNGFLQSPPAPVLWSNFQHPMHMHGYSAVPPHMLNNCAHPMDHHIGSAPNNVGGFTNIHTFHPGSLENVRIPGSPYRETMFSPMSVGFPSVQQFFHATNGRNPMVRVSTSFDATNDRIRSRRHDGNAVQSENKKQFELDIDRIAKGEDLRTTLMIKNIPNKYNCKLLLAVIDENHQGTYDFIYLPIDFKNKCNVGYAFINMTDPQHIIPFYKTFNGKKWEKFNSEKVASLAYARIQGRNALITHFQNSSLMNEEKWCRPILFHKDGPNAGDQEPFPVGNNVRSRSGRNRPLTGSDTRDGSPSASPN